MKSKCPVTSLLKSLRPQEEEKKDTNLHSLVPIIRRLRGAFRDIQVADQKKENYSLEASQLHQNIVHSASIIFLKLYHQSLKDQKFSSHLSDFILSQKRSLIYPLSTQGETSFSSKKIALGISPQFLKMLEVHYSEEFKSLQDNLLKKGIPFDQFLQIFTMGWNHAILRTTHVFDELYDKADGDKDTFIFLSNQAFLKWVVPLATAPLPVEKYLIEQDFNKFPDILSNPITEKQGDHLQAGFQFLFQDSLYKRILTSIFPRKFYLYTSELSLAHLGCPAFRAKVSDILGDSEKNIPFLQWFYFKLREDYVKSYFG